jgi:hypothetical protein
MATLLELADFAASADHAALVKKIKVAIAKKAVAVGNLATPTAEQIAWAKDAIAAPDRYAGIVINYVLAANASASIAQIVAATDTAIETQVGNAVDKILSL